MKYKLVSIVIVGAVCAAILPLCAQTQSCSSACGSCTTAEGSTEFIRFTFETGDLQGWRIIDGKFGQLLCDQKMFRNKKNSDKEWNKEGRYFINTCNLPNGEWSDKMTGVLASPVFVLGGPTISFLVGGGRNDDTYVALCTMDGNEVFSASGISDEIMQGVTWDAKDYVGQKVFMKIVDDHGAGWGHVTFDDFQAMGSIDDAAELPTLTVKTKRKASPANRNVIQQSQKGPMETKALIEALDKSYTPEKIAEKMCKIEALMSPERLFERGKPTVYTGDRLDAISMPLGGIGAGCIQINGKAERHIWQIFNNYPPVKLPHSFFAVRAKTKGGEPVVKSMQTSAVGPFAAMKSLSFRGEYPLGQFDFEDPNLPVTVSMETFSPTIPLRAKDSARPCVIFNLTAKNNSKQPVEVSFLAAQQNAVGYTGQEDFEGRSFKEYGGNRNTVIREDGTLLLHMTSDAKDRPGHGEMALAVFDKGATADASWDNLDTLVRDISDDGTVRGKDVAGPSPEGETIDGALAVPFTLNPGESRTVTFVLAWYFPGKATALKRWSPNGNMYANWWKDAPSVVRDVRDHYDELARLTRLYRDTLYASNLPFWMLDRISSQVAVLSSKTCFWNQDGDFGGWEGCNAAAGCCPGNCAHVWHYAQSHARLFPSIGRRMREQALLYQGPDGGIPFRQPLGEPDPKAKRKIAFDGQCGEVLGAYREHLCSADDAWLMKNWPKIKLAMNYIIMQWDVDEDGVPEGPQHNTLDGSLGGSTSWLGSMYLSALAASERMALLQKTSADAQRYRRIRLSGAKKQTETLWNGEYYIQVPGPDPLQDYGNGSHIDMMLGEWWARQLGLETHYPLDRTRSSLRALIKYNFKPDFKGIAQLPRKFVDDNDSGMQMICWPHNDRPANHIRYADEVMSGFEYSAAGALVQAGMLKEGFLVIRAAFDRYDGRLRTGLAGASGTTKAGRSAWGISGNPFGDDECGKFYARPMSIWSLLLACQGFIYDGPAGKIGFKPLWKPEDHVSFFTGAEGWGLFTQKRSMNAQNEKIEVKFGTLKIRELVFEVPGYIEPEKVAVRMDKQDIPVTVLPGDSPNQLTLICEKPVTLKTGSVLNVDIKRP